MENKKMSMSEFAEIACAIDARIVYYESRIERAKETKSKSSERYYKGVLDEINAAKRKFWALCDGLVDAEMEG